MLKKREISSPESALTRQQTSARLVLVEAEQAVIQAAMAFRDGCGRGQGALWDACDALHRARDQAKAADRAAAVARRMVEAAV